MLTVSVMCKDTKQTKTEVTNSDSFSQGTCPCGGNHVSKDFFFFKVVLNNHHPSTVARHIIVSTINTKLF